MKFALVQQNISWGDTKANRAHLDLLLYDVLGVDVVVLPEMFSTGFVTYNPELAETYPSDTIEWMQTKAQMMDCAIAGSIALKDGNRYVNHFCFVTPDGKVETYDKRHLFAYGGEDKTFSPGSRRVIVNWRGARMLLAVCYDLRFPVWLRNRDDYDGILLCANWPDKRRLAWDVLKRARAIENQCFVAAVNRCGTDPACNYDGGTAFINPYGEITAAADDYAEQVVIVDFDLNAQKDYHKKFPVLQDADKFELI